MAFLKHPDMPRGILGIPGANMWNVLIANVVIAWWINRRQEGVEEGDSARSIKIAVRLYLAVVVIAFLRMFINPTSFYPYGRGQIFTEFFLNPIRFLIPAFLFYDGARTRSRVVQGLGAIVLLYSLLAVQVIRYMGLHPDFSGSELSGRAAKIVQRSVGYDRVDMSMMLAGASWAAIAFASLAQKKSHKFLLLGVGLMIVFGQALTGGRAGYVSWGAIGIVLCTLRWRKMLPLIPVAAVIVVMLMPSVAQRMFSGFGGQSDGIVTHQDDTEITSGRNMIWPKVIEKIRQNPIVGYGRQAMMRTGLTQWGEDVLQDEFAHPHEAYLEMLLDNGLIGFFCVLPLFYIALKRSTGLFRDRSDTVYEAAGGTAMALMLALFFAGFGAQTLYPREGVVGMWAAIGIALRLSVMRERGESLDGISAPEEAVIVEELVEEDFNSAHAARA